jgi:hypothetical protein
MMPSDAVLNIVFKRACWSVNTATCLALVSIEFCIVRDNLWPYQRSEPDHEQDQGAKPGLLAFDCLNFSQLDFETRIVNFANELIQLTHLS